MWWFNWLISLSYTFQVLSIFHSLVFHQRFSYEIFQQKKIFSYETIYAIRDFNLIISFKLIRDSLHIQSFFNKINILLLTVSEDSIAMTEANYRRGPRPGVVNSRLQKRRNRLSCELGVKRDGTYYKSLTSTSCYNKM